KHTVRDITFLDALIAGTVQGIAVIPGISRSGSTIAALLARGADKEMAPKLSFLLYLVVSFGVALIGIDEVRGTDIQFGPLIAMTLASFLVGYAALKLVFVLLRRGKFRAFSPYLWVVGAFTIFYATFIA